MILESGPISVMLGAAQHPRMVGARDDSIRMKKIAVLLVDDHAVVRQGLRALLEAEGDMKVAGEAENGREAVGLAKKTLPDVVLMDLAMPGLNGLEATRQIVRNVPSVKVLILSSYGEDHQVAQLMEAGAVGYLVKQTAAEDLLKAIRRGAGRPCVLQSSDRQTPAAARPG